MFVSKARTYPNYGPFRCPSIGRTPRLIHKHYTRLERPISRKHSSLFRIFVNYVLICVFFSLGPGVFCIKLKFKLSCCVVLCRPDIYFYPNLIFFQVSLNAVWNSTSSRCSLHARVSREEIYYI